MCHHFFPCARLQFLTFTFDPSASFYPYANSSTLCQFFVPFISYPVLRELLFLTCFLTPSLLILFFKLIYSQSLRYRCQTNPFISKEKDFSTEALGAFAVQCLTIMPHVVPTPNYTQHNATSHQSYVEAPPSEQSNYTALAKDFLRARSNLLP